MIYDNSFIYRCRHCGEILNYMEVVDEFCESCNFFNIDDEPIDFSFEMTPVVVIPSPDLSWLNANPDLTNQLKLF